MSTRHWGKGEWFIQSRWALWVHQPTQRGDIEQAGWLGLVISAMPGLTVSMAVVLLLPFTFYLESGPSLGLMLGVFVGGMAGGAISAILINIPGNPASVITNGKCSVITKNS